MTVIVSSSAPTRISASIFALNVPASATPSRLDGVEAGQHEGHGVGAGHEVDDLILTGRVAHHRANLLDQGGARRFDGHAQAGPHPTCLSRRPRYLHCANAVAGIDEMRESSSQPGQRRDESHINSLSFSGQRVPSYHDAGGKATRAE